MKTEDAKFEDGLPRLWMGAIENAQKMLSSRLSSLEAIHAPVDYEALGRAVEAMVREISQRDR